MWAKVAFLLLVGALGLTISAVSGIPYVWALVLSAGAVFINGLIATLEDHLPGGFNNPDDTDTPPYVGNVAAIVRWTGSLLLVCIAFLLVAAVGRGTLSAGLGIGLGTGAGLLGAALFRRSRLAMWGSALCIVVGFGTVILRA